MAWPGKSPTAEELIGMKPEDLKAKLDGAATKDDLTKLTTDVSSSLTELKKTLEAIKTQPANGDGGGDGGDYGSGDGNDPPDSTIQIIADPDKFVDKKMKPLQDTVLSNQAMVLEMRARQNPTMQGAFQQYGNELVEAANKLPLQMRAQSNFWEYHIRTILGDKLMKGEIREGKFPSLIGSSSVVPNVTGTAKDENRGFSKEQVEWFGERKIPLESARAILNMYDDWEPITQVGYQNYKKQVANAAA